jgi:hypothetical protein
MPPWLTPHELANASQRKRADAQLKWAVARRLVSMGPDGEPLTDADGRPLVLRDLVFGTGTQPVVKPQANWGALRG